MRKFTFWPVAVVTLVSMLLLQSCRDDSSLALAPAVPNQSFVEEFDTVSASIGRGWKIINMSEPKGSSIWQQGGNIAPWFSPYSNNGSYAGFIGADYESVRGGPGVISNWLISPVVTMQNGDTITFYTRSWSIFDGVSDTTDFGNSLQLRINPINESINVGQGLSTGDFTNTLLYINPDAVYSSTTNPDPKAYPTQWTKFEGVVSGLNNPTRGRFAFRYYLSHAGLCADCTGQGVAIDKVEYSSISK